MKNLLTVRFLNFGLPQKLNELFIKEMGNFDIAKLEPAMKSEKPHEYLVPLKDNFLNLVYILANMDNAMMNFKKRNIPDDIILDSLNDVTVWIMNLYNSTGEVGLSHID